MRMKKSAKVKNISVANMRYRMTWKESYRNGFFPVFLILSV